MQLVQANRFQPEGELMEFSETPQAAAPAPNPLLLVHSLLRGRYHWAILLGLILAGVGIFLGYKLPPVKYRSSGLIRVLPNKQKILYTNEENTVMPMFDAFVESQVSLINSPRVLDYAMQNPEWQALGRGLSPKVVGQFRDAVEVEHPRGSEVIIISFSDADPNVATVGVRAITQAYKDLYGENDADNPAHILQVLEDRRATLTSELASWKKQILEVANEFGTTDIDSYFSIKLQEVNNIETELQQAQLFLASVDAPVAAPKNAPATQPVKKRAITAEGLATIDPQVQQLMQERLSQQSALTKMESRLGAKNPEVKSSRDYIVWLTKQINDRVEAFNAAQSATANALPPSSLVPSPNGGGELNRNVDLVQRKAANLQTMLTTARAQLMDVGHKNLQLQSLKASEEACKQRLDETTARIEHLNVESNAGGRMIVISNGDRPLEPYKDKRVASAAGGGAGGMGLGIALIALIGLINRRFRSLADAQMMTNPGIPLLGVLPDLPSQIENPEEAAAAAHCLHHIRTALQIRRDSHDERVYAITSPAAGAGKTSTTLALGLSFAAARCKTLILDCDIVGGGLTARIKKTCHRKIGQILMREGLLTEEQLAKALPIALKYHKRLGEVLVKLGWLTTADIDHALSVQSQSQLGLLDVLNGEPLAECTIGTGIPGLFVLPLGGATSSHVGQLSPYAMRAIVDVARQEYDAVLIDTGPVLGSLEASIVAAEADKVLLVLSRGEPQALAQKSITKLRSIGAHIAGVVFNRATIEDVEVSGYSSARTNSAGSARRTTSVRTMTMEDGVTVGPIGTAVASSTAAHGHVEGRS